MEDEMTRREFRYSKSATTLSLASLLAVPLTLAATLAHAIITLEAHSPVAAASVQLAQALNAIGPLTLQVP